MQEIKLFENEIGQLLRELPNVKREALERAGREALQAVRTRIGGRGKVQRWQELHMGSRGGYAAVRAVAGQYDAHGYAVGYVTNAIESGHRSGGRNGSDRRVPGKEMYKRTQGDAEALAAKSAKEIEDAMEKIAGE